MCRHFKNFQRTNFANSNFSNANDDRGEGMNLLMWLTEGARIENATAPQTIGPDLASSFRSHSLTEETEAGEEPIKPDRTR